MEKADLFYEEETGLCIRKATEADAEALVQIYAPYIRKTAVTFEYEVPSVEEFRARIAHTLERYPYLVAEKKGRFWGMLIRVPLLDVPPVTGLWKYLFT